MRGFEDALLGGIPLHGLCVQGSLGQPWPLMVLPHSVWEDEEMLLVLSWSEDLGV